MSSIKQIGIQKLKAIAASPSVASPEERKVCPQRIFSIIIVLSLIMTVLSMSVTAGLSAPAAAVIPVVASSTQFDLTGFLQSATLDTPGDNHSGGTLMINGHLVIVPRETIVILPANALTWEELFTHAPAPYSPTQTGMALNDNPKPLTTYEVQAVGNRVVDPVGANGCSAAVVGYVAATNSCDRYIAGLVHVSNQDLNSGAGYINFMNYAAGEMEVGGQPGVQGTGARLRINDPANATALDENGAAGSGRFGRAMTPDDRFQVDQDNPTIAAATGYPMCFPRVTLDPTIAGNPDDPQCPQANRPIYSGVDTSGIVPQPALPNLGEFYTLFRMPAPGGGPAAADPRFQAPMEVGDYVNYAGTLIQDGGANGGYYISAHTIINNTGIYTQPGVDPAYVSIEVALMGTGGLTVFGAGEAAIRTRFEGMSTDETRLIRLYGVDIDSVTGATSDREWGTILPDPGPNAGGAVRGRWRFRPPCTAAIATDKKCTPPPSGQFIPPTREVRAVINGLSQFQPGTLTANPASQVPGTPSAVTAANGIFFGQYHAPIGEYIFPENIPGTAVPENNFNTIPFLAYGGYQSITGVQAAVLNPWPSSIPAPILVCAVPSFNSAPYSVANGAAIQLSGSVTAGASTPITLQWTAGTVPGGTDLAGALTNTTTTTPSFNATGLAAGVYFLSFTAANDCGASTVGTTITVQPAPPPTINAIQNQTVTAGNLVTITASSVSNPFPTWTWVQTAGPVNPLAFTQVPAAATPSANSTITFTPNTAGTYTFSVTAANLNGASPATLVNINVTPNVPTNITLNPVTYRTSQQRLVITATSLDPTVTSMVLQPYLTETGTMFDPATLGVNNLTISLIAPGTFTITAVGAPRPACNLGGTYATPCAQRPLTAKAVRAGTPGYVGTSAPTALTLIRQ